jgi:hypothetical protein
MVAAPGSLVRSTTVAARPEAHAQCLDMREVDLPPRIVFWKLMPLRVDQARVSTYL